MTRHILVGIDSTSGYKFIAEFRTADERQRFADFERTAEESPDVWLAIDTGPDRVTVQVLGMTPMIVSDPILDNNDRLRSDLENS